MDAVAHIPIVWNPENAYINHPDVRAALEGIVREFNDGGLGREAGDAGWEVDQFTRCEM